MTRIADIPRLPAQRKTTDACSSDLWLNYNKRPLFRLVLDRLRTWLATSDSGLAVVVAGLGGLIWGATCLVAVAAGFIQ